MPPATRRQEVGPLVEGGPLAVGGASESGWGEGGARRRTLGTLAVAQALGLSGAPLVVMVAGVVGRELAPAPSLATLPLAAMVVGTALASGPAALLMQRVGRRRGFALGAAAALAAGIAGAAAVAAGSFAALCSATLLVGVGLAFVMQYRFAAAEAAGPEGAARAVGLVLTGGIVAGLIGPEVGRLGRDLLATPYAGSFLGLACVYAVLIVVLLLGLPRGAPPPVAVRPAAAGRRTALLRRPAFLYAAAAATTAYAVMTLVMTATPLAMHGVGFDVDATAIVIQAHVVAMYAPSLVAGALVARLGLGRLMAAGIAAMAACLALGLGGHGLAAWVGALVLLGAGWNALFLGGTVALARAFPGEERFQAQAVNDVLVFGTQAAASLGAGLILAAGGWRGVTVAAFLPLVAMSLLLAARGLEARTMRRSAAGA